MLYGLPGWSSQTVAVQTLLARSAGAGRKRVTKKRRVTRKRASPKRRRTTARKSPARRKTRRTKKPAYMVKGSAAAKRRMAQLRRMRKK